MISSDFRTFYKGRPLGFQQISVDFLTFYRGTLRISSHLLGGPYIYKGRPFGAPVARDLRENEGPGSDGLTMVTPSDPWLQGAPRRIP